MRRQQIRQGRERHSLREFKQKRTRRNSARSSRFSLFLLSQLQSQLVRAICLCSSCFRLRLADLPLRVLILRLTSPPCTRGAVVPTPEDLFVVAPAQVRQPTRLPPLPHAPPRCPSHPLPFPFLSLALLSLTHPLSTLFGAGLLITSDRCAQQRRRRAVTAIHPP